MGNFFSPGFKQMPGVGGFQGQLQNLMNQWNVTPGSGGLGPFAQWSSQVGKWLANPNKQAKNPFESGGGGLFSAFTDPVTAAYGQTLKNIKQVGQNPLISGQYQPIQQAVTQQQMQEAGDQYGMGLRGAMQQAIGTAMGEYNNALGQSNSMLTNLLGQYGGTLRDVVQTASPFQNLMQGVGAVGSLAGGIANPLMGLFGGAGGGGANPPSIAPYTGDPYGGIGGGMQPAPFGVPGYGGGYIP